MYACMHTLLLKLQQAPTAAAALNRRCAVLSHLSPRAVGTGRTRRTSGFFCINFSAAAVVVVLSPNGLSVRSDSAARTACNMALPVIPTDRNGTTYIAILFVFLAYVLHPRIEKTLERLRAYRAWRSIENGESVEVSPVLFIIPIFWRECNIYNSSINTPEYTFRLLFRSRGLYVF